MHMYVCIIDGTASIETWLEWLFENLMTKS